MDNIFRNSPNVGSIGAEEALRLGAVPLIGPARPTPIYQTSSDFDPDDTYRGRIAGSSKTRWPGPP